MTYFITRCVKCNKYMLNHSMRIIEPDLYYEVDGLCPVCDENAFHGEITLVRNPYIIFGISSTNKLMHQFHMLLWQLYIDSCNELNMARAADKDAKTLDMLDKHRWKILGYLKQEDFLTVPDLTENLGTPSNTKTPHSTEITRKAT